jgi:hypothetical protein
MLAKVVRADARLSSKQMKRYTSTNERIAIRASVGAAATAIVSHSDQTTYWQTLWPDQVARTGWDGRARDSLASRNNGSLSISMSVAGNSLFLASNNDAVDQPKLLKKASDAIAAFYNATVELGIANAVTTFIASDFGRFLQSNGRGSNHGWGGHHLVVGGAVPGKRVYGHWPDVTLGGAQDARQGRWVPAIAVDQYAAMLASWMGVTATDIGIVVRNIRRLATANLGFMA